MLIKKVLILEDHVGYRESLANFVFSSYNVYFAFNREELIQKATQNNYSLILINDQLEDNDWYKTLYAIEQIKKSNKSTPIFINTTTLPSDLREIAKKIGVNEIINRLSGFKILEEKVKQYLK